jgi:hypothetical protein
MNKPHRVSKGSSYPVAQEASASPFCYEDLKTAQRPPSSPFRHDLAGLALGAWQKMVHGYRHG